MKGSVAIEALMISVVAILLLVFAGNAVQAYGAKFAEDVDRMAWIRQSVYKIYASVRMLETCGTGSVDTIDVYVPHNGRIELLGHTITGKVWGLSREYPGLAEKDTYSYTLLIGTHFRDFVALPQGWARIRLEKTADEKIRVDVIMTGVVRWKNI